MAPAELRGTPDRGRCLALIPARGGSKGLPGKNIRPLLGRPLVAWTVEQALASERIDRVVVSTNDENIAAVARTAGADVPFLRPAELATDESPVIDAVLHALDRLSEEEGMGYEVLALLEPTSPLRRSGEIDQAIKMLEEHPHAGSLVSVGRVAHEHPAYLKQVSEQNTLAPLLDVDAPARRQENSAVYYPYGQIFLTRVEDLRRTRSFYAPPTLPHLLERWQCFEIDDLWDFLAVEAVLRHHRKGDAG